MKNNQTQIKTDPGSFKDPSGGVFFYKNNVYRSVASSSAKFYEKFVESECFNNLVKENLFISSKPVTFKNDPMIAQKYGYEKKYFEHDLIEFLTYPFEWSASMLIDAGIHTLNLQKKLLKIKLLNKISN